ncbi:hypothetical protein ACS0TY_027541 [Phlomoides rotata]
MQRGCSWIKEGDANFRSFHNYINNRRKRNEISGISIEGAWREEDLEVKQGVFECFKSHFSSDRRSRPTLCDNFADRKVTGEDNQLLTAEFSEAKIKEAFDSCDSSKSLCPDDINFGFLREFWCLIKDDLMRFMGEFHRYGKLVFVEYRIGFGFEGEHR